MSGKKRSIREHRTAAKAWDAARAATTSSRANDPQWAEWAKRQGKAARRQLKAQQRKP